MTATMRKNIVIDHRQAHRVRDARQKKSSAWNRGRSSRNYAATGATPRTRTALDLRCVERESNQPRCDERYTKGKNCTRPLVGTPCTRCVTNKIECVERESLERQLRCKECHSENKSSSRPLVRCKMCRAVNEDCSCSAQPLLDLVVPFHALQPPRIVPVIADDDPGEDDGRSGRKYTVGDMPSAIAWLMIESIELSPNIDFQRWALASIQKIAPTEDIWAGASRSHYHTVMARWLELELGDSPQGMFIHVCIFIHLTVTLEVLDYSKPVNDDTDYDGDYGEELDKSIELAAQDSPCEGPVTPANARAEMTDTTKPIISDMITDEAQRSFAAPLPTLVKTLRKSIPAQPTVSSSTPKKASSSLTKKPKQKTKDPKPKPNSKPPHAVLLVKGLAQQQQPAFSRCLPCVDHTVAVLRFDQLDFQEGSLKSIRRRNSNKDVESYLKAIVGVGFAPFIEGPVVLNNLGGRDMTSRTGRRATDGELNELDEETGPAIGIAETCFSTTMSPQSSRNQVLLS
ncbi:hypothetical protein B0H13DRAFT_1896598 [Mycena leptocephala]|nr:hypothetical protein B0H13DRAFT_1896598 [Mycena leptocephala]